MKQERVEAAARALAELAPVDPWPLDDEFHAACIDLTLDMLAAADAVPFSVEAIERAAKALAGSFANTRWDDLGPITKQYYRDQALSVSDALRGGL